MNMKLNSKILATAAFAAFLMPAFGLASGSGGQAARNAGDGKAADSSSGSSADSGVPVPATSMAPDAPYARRANNNVPRIEWFLGYSYLRATPTLASGNRMMWLNGGSTSLAFNFNRYLAVVGDFGGFRDSELRLSGTGGNPSSVVDSSGSVYTYLAGPRLSFFKNDRLTPFAQALFGGVHASDVTLSSCPAGSSCTLLPVENKFAMTAGGGLDIRVHRHFAIRLVQAEYLMTRFEDLDTGKSVRQDDMRLSSGIVLRFGGGAPQLPLTYSCSVNPSTAFAGDAIAVSGSALNLRPARTAVYTWTADGGTVSGTSETAHIDTANVAPGSYTLKGHVSEGGKPQENADCSASFTVKAFDPPTLSCSASPNTIQPNGSSTVTASGVSPQNRPLTYSYSAPSGSISGNGATATFSAAGAPAGPVEVTCNVIDDKGKSATAATTITVAPAPEAPAPEQVRLEARLALHSVFFPTAQPKETHPEGGLVESQQLTLKTLAEDFKAYLAMKPEAHLILTGHADVRGTPEYNQALTERRVNRVKQFLVEQGVAENDIETHAVGEEQQLSQDQVKDLIQRNPDITDSERQKILHDLTTIVLAQNRRVDITLTTTGQQSVKLYPFNAEDAMTLLNQKATAPRKQTHSSAKPAPTKQ